MACLYRSHWVPKGRVGNTHGYAVQTYVGSLPRDSDAIPEALASVLTADELSYVERSICGPAREVADRVRREAALRDGDPIWRLAEAERLVSEAVERSHQRRVPRDAVEPIAKSLGRLNVLGASEQRATPQRSDPLSDALAAVRAAASAIRDGAVGSAPASGARTTRTYVQWARIVAEVDGTADDSLLDALQARGFVKRRRG